MSDLDPKSPAFDLEALFAEDAPPAHDADFLAAVVRRTSRRRLAIELTWLGLTAGLTALVLWAVGPLMAPLLRPLGLVVAVLAPLGACAGAVLVLLHPRTSPF